ncbi:hypothetical protein ACVXG7_12680 [Enterobacter hormaechei]
MPTVLLIDNLPDGVERSLSPSSVIISLVTTQTDVASLRKQLAGQPLARRRRSAARVEPVDTTAFAAWLPVVPRRRSLRCSVKPTLRA